MFLSRPVGTRIPAALLPEDLENRAAAFFDSVSHQFKSDAEKADDEEVGDTDLGSLRPHVMDMLAQGPFAGFAEKADWFRQGIQICFFGAFPFLATVETQFGEWEFPQAVLRLWGSDGAEGLIDDRQQSGDQPRTIIKKPSCFNCFRKKSCWRSSFDAPRFKSSPLFQVLCYFVL